MKHNTVQDTFHRRIVVTALVYVFLAVTWVQGLAPARVVVFLGVEETSQVESFDQPSDLVQFKSPPSIIFLHGRLEAEEGEPSFGRPSELYSDFCRRLTHRLIQDGNHDATLWLIEFDHLLVNELKREPRNFGMGPISNAIADAIPSNSGSCLANGKPILVTFSMGAAMGLKLLSKERHKDQFSKVVFIEPVWRCWLTLAERTILTNTPALAVVGSRDEETGHDSGNNVFACLKPFFQEGSLQVQHIEGGNHWGILNDNIEIAMDRLEPDRTPCNIQEEMVDHIISFAYGSV